MIEHAVAGLEAASLAVGALYAAAYGDICFPRFPLNPVFVWSPISIAASICVLTFDRLDSPTCIKPPHTHHVLEILPSVIAVPGRRVRDTRLLRPVHGGRGPFRNAGRGSSTLRSARSGMRCVRPAKRDDWFQSGIGTHGCWRENAGGFRVRRTHHPRSAGTLRWLG